METMTHHRRAGIAAEKRSPFRPHRGLAAPDLFSGHYAQLENMGGTPD
jgi:hypothetical protein